MTAEEILRNRTDAIRERAYCIWQAEGYQVGHELDHWLRAERTVAAGETAQRAAPPADDAPAIVTQHTKSAGAIKRARAGR